MTRSKRWAGLVAGILVPHTLGCDPGPSTSDGSATDDDNALTIDATTTEPGSSSSETGLDHEKLPDSQDSTTTTPDDDVSSTTLTVESSSATTDTSTTGMDLESGQVDELGDSEETTSETDDDAGEEESSDDMAADQLDAILRGLDAIEQTPSFPERPLAHPDNASDVHDGNYVCDVQWYEAAPNFSQMTVLDPTTDIVYVGSIVDGRSVASGAYTPVTEARRPITISASLENIDGPLATTVDDPKLSSVRQAVSDMLRQGLDGATPANVSFEIAEIHSEAQLQLAIGANLEYLGGVASVASGFDFEDTKARSRVLVRFIQSYYTIDIDLPLRPSDLFGDPADVNVDALAGTSPMYVSSVNYGRLALFAVESEYSETELEASLSAAMNAAIVNGSLELSAAHRRVLEASSIQGTVLGGAAGDAVQTITGLDAMAQYITSHGEYSKDSPGAPMSYKLRYVADNSLGNIVLSSQYRVRKCELASLYDHRVRVRLDRFMAREGSDPGDELELYGHMASSAFDALGNDVDVLGPEVLWNHDESNAQDIDEDGGVLPVAREVLYTFRKPNRRDSYIALDGWLKEDDRRNDDDLGANHRRIHLDDIVDEHEVRMTYSDGDTTIETVFILTHLD